MGYIKNLKSFEFYVFKISNNKFRTLKDYKSHKLQIAYANEK